jgi:hypothetical protein
MPKNRLEDLRDHLFETLEALRDKEEPMDIERARAVAEVSGVLIESAKVELKFLELTGQESQSKFLNPKPEAAELPAKTPQGK